MWADQFQGLNNPLDNKVTWCASGNLPTLLRNSTSDNIYSKTRLIVAAIDMCCNQVACMYRQDYLLYDRGIVIRSQQRMVVFSSPKWSDPLCNPPSLILVLGTLSPDVKWAGREADHIVPRLKNSWGCTSAPRLPSWLASIKETDIFNVM